MNELSNRVQERMADLKIPSEQSVVDRLLQHGVKITQPAFHKVKNGQTKNPGYIVELAMALECNLRWLKFNKGTKCKKDTVIGIAEENNSSYSVEAIKASQFRAVTLWGHPSDLPEDEFILINQLDIKAAAGNGHVNSDWPTTKRQMAFRSSWVKKSKAQSNELVLIEIIGDSMLPTLAHGDDALVDLSQTDIKNGQVYAFVLDGEVKVKRLNKTIDKIQIESDNSADPRYRIPEEIPQSHIDDMHIIGRIVNRSGSGGL